MGGSCSAQRSRSRLHERRYNSHQSGSYNERMCRHRLIRHSVESELPDGFISDLYPTDDNYVVTAKNRRSPKSLVDLCIDQVCRSLPDLDGDLPPGLPEDIVHAIVKSLVDHSALNATTLRALRNCELGKLSLAGCRGVRDDWLKIFSHHVEDSINPNLSNTHGSCGGKAAGGGVYDMEYIGKSMDTSELKRPAIYDKSPSPCSSNASHLNHFHIESDSASSHSTSSFVTASSTPNLQAAIAAVATIPTANYGPENLEICSKSDQYDISYYSKSHKDASYDDSMEMHEYLLASSDIHFPQHEYQTTTPNTTYNEPPYIASTLTLLDLCGSQRITDRGLLQLHNLTSLEIAKLDNCHSITGRGLVALSNSHHLHTLSLVNCRRLTDEAIVNISHLSSSLEALVLEGCRCLTDRSLVAISNLISLRKLDLSQCDLITNEAIKFLYPLEFIEELYLGWCRNIGNEGLKIISSQPGRNTYLKVLRLARCPITDQGCKYLPKLAALEELDLNGCNKIDSQNLGKALELLKHLKVLDVSYCPGILRSSWQNKIKNLKSLFLNYSGVSDVDLSRLVNLPTLEELNLDSCPIGDWAIAHFADNNVIPNLTSLDLADSDLTDDGMAHLPKFEKITRLSLFYCNISNAGLQHVARMKHLEVLNLDSRDIGDEGLVHLKHLKHLRSLDLFSGRVTDVGCSYLAMITSLESLELCGGGISDFGCSQLARLENLTSLNLSQNERITNRGAAALATLSKLRALNLSNTKVTSTALHFLSALSKLQSLALYGCHGVDNNTSISLLHNELPSLKCLRLNRSNVDDILSSEEDDDEEEEEEEDSVEGVDAAINNSMASLNSLNVIGHAETARLWEELRDGDNYHDDDNYDDDNDNDNRDHEYTRMIETIEVDEQNDNNLDGDDEGGEGR